jgi:carbonic anhydrase
MTIAKKTLIITGLNKKLHQLFPIITNKKSEELIIVNSFGAVMSQPYGCIIRSIIMGIYCEDVGEIYIIVEKGGKEHLITEEALFSTMQESGVSKEMIKTIDYINVVGNEVLNWLVGPQDAKIITQQNIALIKNHPLIPKSVSVFGYIVNIETSNYEAV